MNKFLSKLRVPLQVQIVAVSAMLLSTGLAFLPTATASAAINEKQCLSSHDPTSGHWTTNISYQYGLGDWCIQQTLMGNQHRLVWQTDGNLVEYTNSIGNPAIWASHTTNRGVYLYFSTTGRVEIIDANGKAIWYTTNQGLVSNSGFWMSFDGNGDGIFWVHQHHGTGAGYHSTTLWVRN